MKKHLAKRLAAVGLSERGRPEGCLCLRMCIADQ